MTQWLALVVFLAASQAWAVNKCVGSDGRVSFQDAPCVGKGEALNVKPATGLAPVPQARPASPQGESVPMTEAQRLNKMADDSAKERRLRDLSTRLIPGARANLNQHRIDCKETQSRLQSQQYRYAQNLYGKTHAAQIASEMAAAAATCNTRDRELKEQLEAFEKESETLGRK